MSTDPYRDWDAAYVLGALAPGERREFEEHLAACDACRAAVGELAGMPALLGMVPQEQVDAAGDERDGPADVVPLARVAAAAHRRRARGRVALAGVAAALVVLAGATGAAVTAATAARPAVVAADARTVALAPVAGSGVSADLTLAPVAWGTRLDWSCAYEAAELPEGVYTLVLVDAAGERSVVATWTSTGERAAAGLGASSALPLEGIARVELGVVGLDRPLAVGEVATA
ncbi:anti-sigma factor family protein [Cellulomonas phragmiteti]|uniref:Putative zinc-finger domain-containing protein n=1 Tax=Cellulomonas phragmiteti TaxID=478780 RepID=A0ABQ4DS65_9CELL|nr:zf-HC2 domain-containing protein [Cellulomonas phragmiteti]GIG41796.1 hypothetical protein Cph01nite_35580 [Cellulomonas phragmiteti]